MKVLRRTPRTEMVFAAIVQKMAEFYQDVAKAEKLPVDAVDRELTRFAKLSSRIEFDEQTKHDFELALPNDTPEQVRAKFASYLDTEFMALIEEADKAIRQCDQPVEDAVAPVPPEPGSKKA